MRTRTALAVSAAATFITATEVLAVTGAREDTSGLFVWAFLGMCALIVTAQVIPALLMVVGAARGLVRKTAREAALEAVETR